MTTNKKPKMVLCRHLRQPWCRESLDGVNGWEYYPYNAFHFRSSLSKGLSASKQVETFTFDEAVDEYPAVDLADMCPGSWVCGSISTWTGDIDKNHVWDLPVRHPYLIQGRDAPSNLDHPLSSGGVNAEKAGTMRRGHEGS